MCELFAVDSAENVKINSELEEFFSHSDKHMNGWGMAFFYGDAVSLEKEPRQALKSDYLRERLRTDIIVKDMFAHIRLATMGEVNYVNTHPFIKEDDSGRRWTLIHNGTMLHFPELDKYVKCQCGTSDSERVLLYIVDMMNEEIAKAGHPLDEEERFNFIDGIIGRMADKNKLNMILYDGDLMYVHSNVRDSLYTRQTKNTAYFSTQPLRCGRWEPMTLNVPVAYKNGHRVFTGTDHGFEYVENEKDMEMIFAAYSCL
jgi:predicted glutamine amidotransferase